MVHVVITPAAVVQIAGLPTPIVARMENLVQRLRQWPHVSGVKALKGDLAGRFRLRTGDYRLQFRVQTQRIVTKVEKIVKGKPRIEELVVLKTKVIVERAGHRDGFYDE